MASSKRKKHGAGYVVLIAVLILVLLAVVAAVTGYSLVAVSYTHLDVYKRQAWMCTTSYFPNAL